MKRATSALMNLTPSVFWVGALSVNPVLHIGGGMEAGNENHKCICLRGSRYLQWSDGGYSTLLSQKMPYAALFKK